MCGTTSHVTRTVHDGYVRAVVALMQLPGQGFKVMAGYLQLLHKALLAMQCFLGKLLVQFRWGAKSCFS